MKIIGITGLSGSGKSQAAEVFVKKGAYLIDADKIGHDIIKKGLSAYNEIVEGFGSGILNEKLEIDRPKLAKIAFSDKVKLSLLNEITHKHIIRDIMGKIEGVHKNPENFKCIVIDAILLVESGLSRVCDLVISTFADVEKRIDRIIVRDGISLENAKMRISNQSEKLALKASDFVVENNASYAEFITKIEELAEYVISKT